MPIRPHTDCKVSDDFRHRSTNVRVERGGTRREKGNAFARICIALFLSTFLFLFHDFPVSNLNAIERTTPSSSLSLFISPFSLHSTHTNSRFSSKPTGITNPPAVLIPLSFSFPSIITGAHAYAYSLECYRLWDSPTTDNAIGECVSDFIQRDPWVLFPTVIPAVFGLLLLLCYPSVMLGRWCGACGSNRRRPGADCCCDGDEWDAVPTDVKTEVYPQYYISRIKAYSVVLAVLAAAVAVTLPLGVSMGMEGWSYALDHADTDVVAWVQQTRVEMVALLVTGTINSTSPSAGNLTLLPPPLTAGSFAVFDDAVSTTLDFRADVQSLTDSAIIPVLVVTYVLAFIPMLLFGSTVLFAYCGVRRTVLTMMSLVHFIFGLVYAAVACVLLLAAMSALVVEGEAEVQTKGLPGAFSLWAVPQCEAEIDFDGFLSFLESASIANAGDSCDALLAMCDGDADTDNGAAAPSTIATSTAFASNVTSEIMATTAGSTTTTASPSSSKWFYCPSLEASTSAACKGVSSLTAFISTTYSKGSDGDAICGSAPSATSSAQQQQQQQQHLNCSVAECADHCANGQAMAMSSAVLSGLRTTHRIQEAFSLATVKADCSALIDRTVLLFAEMGSVGTGLIIAGSGATFALILIILGTVLLCKGQKVFVKRVTVGDHYGKGDVAAFEEAAEQRRARRAERRAKRAAAEAMRGDADGGDGAEREGASRSATPVSIGIGGGPRGFDRVLGDEANGLAIGLGGGGLSPSTSPSPSPSPGAQQQQQHASDAKKDKKADKKAKKEREDAEKKAKEDAKQKKSKKGDTPTVVSPSSAAGTGSGGLSIVVGEANHHASSPSPSSPMAMQQSPASPNTRRGGGAGSGKGRGDGFASVNGEEVNGPPPLPPARPGQITLPSPTELRRSINAEAANNNTTKNNKSTYSPTRARNGTAGDDDANQPSSQQPQYLWSSSNFSYSNPTEAVRRGERERGGGDPNPPLDAAPAGGNRNNKQRKGQLQQQQPPLSNPQHGVVNGNNALPSASAGLTAQQQQHRDGKRSHSKGRKSGDERMNSASSKRSPAAAVPPQHQQHSHQVYPSPSFDAAPPLLASASPVLNRNASFHQNIASRSSFGPLPPAALALVGGVPSSSSFVGGEGFASSTNRHRPGDSSYTPREGGDGGGNNRARGGSGFMPNGDVEMQPMRPVTGRGGGGGSRGGEGFTSPNRNDPSSPHRREATMAMGPSFAAPMAGSPPPAGAGAAARKSIGGFVDVNSPQFGQYFPSASEFQPSPSGSPQLRGAGGGPHSSPHRRSQQQQRASRGSIFFPNDSFRAAASALPPVNDSTIYDLLDGSTRPRGLSASYNQNFGSNTALRTHRHSKYAQRTTTHDAGYVDEGSGFFTQMDT